MEPRKPANRPPTPTSPAKLVAKLKGHPGGVLALAFTPDRGLLASGGRDGGRLWDLSDTPGKRAGLREGGARFQSMAFSPNGRLLAAGAGSLDGLVYLFDVADKAPRETGLLRGARGAVDALAFSPDGKFVAGAGEDRSVRVWEPGPGSRGEPRFQFPGHTGPVRALAFAPDNHEIATAARDATVRLWDLTRIRNWEREKLPHPAEVNSVVWSPDGKTLATACQDGVIRLWDPKALKPIPRAEFSERTTGVRLVVYTPDSAMLVSVGDGPRVINWDAHSGQPLREWEMPAGPISGIALTPDGRYLAAGRADGTVGVFRVAEKRM